METAVRPRPKYNMMLGLDQIKALSPKDQARFYYTYMEHLSDGVMVSVILKKALNRAGSLGLLDSGLIEEAMEQIEAYDEEHVTNRTSKDVSFIPVDGKMWPTLKNAVNLLGMQGDNCQATFHHRFIYSVKNVPVLSSIVKSVIHHASGRYIIAPVLANMLIAAIEEYSEDME